VGVKIAVIGAGAIGNLVAGYLKLKGLDVCLVGNKTSVEAIKKNGLEISGVRGSFNIKIDISERLDSGKDLIILAVKTQDLATVFKDNLDYIKDSLILTTQNGVQADNIVRRFIKEENIISSIVMFGSTYLEPGKVVHNFEGNWIVGSFFGANQESIQKIEPIIKEAFNAVVVPDIKGMKYLKIFVNANNCIPAILGKSMQECFSDVNISRISIGIWKEGFEVVKKSGINLVSLPDFPLERMLKLISMPSEEAAKIYSGIMMNLSKEPLYGSVYQSIQRGKFSEIDYLNGEFVNLAKQNSASAVLNEKLVEMVHEVENRKKFFSKEELLQNVGTVLS